MDSSGKGDRKEYGEVFLRKIGHKVGEILPMPRTAVKILQLLDDPEVDIKDLEKVVISDQAIVAQVLKIANSALYGYAQTISTVSRALMVMGLITFKNLTLSVSLKSLYKTKGKPDFITTKLWEHSIGVALCSNMLANKMKENIEEEVMI